MVQHKRLQPRLANNAPSPFGLAHEPDVTAHIQIEESRASSCTDSEVKAGVCGEVQGVSCKSLAGGDEADQGL